MGRICKNTEPPPFHSVSISVEPSYQLRTYLTATLSRYQTFLFSLSLSLSLSIYLRMSTFVYRSINDVYFLIFHLTCYSLKYERNRIKSRFQSLNVFQCLACFIVATDFAIFGLARELISASNWINCGAISLSLSSSASSLSNKILVSANHIGQIIFEAEW